MPSKTEIKCSRLLQRELNDKTRAEAEAKMPISKVEMSTLFNHLDAALIEGCDHSLRFAREFLLSKSLADTTIIAWLRDYGGYCDCEVLANVEEQWI